MREITMTLAGGDVVCESVSDDMADGIVRRLKAGTDRFVSLKDDEYLLVDSVARVKIGPVTEPTPEFAEQPVPAEEPALVTGEPQAVVTETPEQAEAVKAYGWTAPDREPLQAEQGVSPDRGRRNRYTGG